MEVDTKRWAASRKGAAPERRSGFWVFLATCPGKGTHRVETDGPYAAARDRALKSFRDRFGRKPYTVELLPAGRDFTGEEEAPAPTRRKPRGRGKA